MSAAGQPLPPEGAAVAFAQKPGSGPDQAPGLPSTLRTSIQKRRADGLKMLEAKPAVLTDVVVGRHEQAPFLLIMLGS